MVGTTASRSLDELDEGEPSDTKVVVLAGDPGLGEGLLVAPECVALGGDAPANRAHGAPLTAVVGVLVPIRQQRQRLRTALPGLEVQRAELRRRASRHLDERVDLLDERGGGIELTGMDVDDGLVVQPE